MKTPRIFMLASRSMLPRIEFHLPGGSRFLREDYAIEYFRLVVKRWPSGKTWPELSDSTLFLVSTAAVINAMNQAGICGLDALRIDDIRYLTPPPCRLVFPQLFAFRPVGRILFEESEIGQAFLNRETSELNRLVPKQIAKTHFDFALADNLEGTWVFCTIEVLLLARKMRWSSFKFIPVDYYSPKHPCYNSDYSINHLSKQWPPQWYPDGFDPHPNNLTSEIPIDPLLK